jgi:CRISPR-associated protein Cas2
MHAIIYASAIPEHLRGYTSRHLSQVAANLYIGHLTPVLADAIWGNLCKHSDDDSELTMIRSDNSSETGYRIEHHGSSRYRAVDLDGIQLPCVQPIPSGVFAKGDEDHA